MYKEVEELNKADRKQASISLPRRGVVESTLTGSDQVKVETFGNAGSQRTMIRHPYMGVNSWIRVMPEQGTPVMTQARVDYANLEIWGYLTSNLPNRHETNKVASSKVFLLRELQEGEMEILSSGRAYAHFSDRGDSEIRGGTIRMSLQQTELRLSQQAPTHHRQLHLYDYQKFGHEEKFGVVRRPDPQNPDLVSKFIRNSDNSFAVEYSRWLNKKGGNPLLTVQEGDVFDEQGKEVKHSTTNKPLRAIRKWFDDQNQSLTLEVDENLNILVSNTNTAKETTLKLGTQNVLDVSGKELKMTFLTNGTLALTQALQIRTAKMNVVAPIINLGSSAAISPLVLGDRLTSAMLTPLISVLSSTFTVLAASSAFSSEQPVQETLKGASNTISGLSSSFPTILSTIVKAAA